MDYQATGQANLSRTTSRPGNHSQDCYRCTTGPAVPALPVSRTGCKGNRLASALLVSSSSPPFHLCMFFSFLTSCWLFSCLIMPPHHMMHFHMTAIMAKGQRSWYLSSIIYLLYKVTKQFACQPQQTRANPVKRELSVTRYFDKSCRVKRQKGTKAEQYQCLAINVEDGNKCRKYGLAKTAWTWHSGRQIGR